MKIYVSHSRSFDFINELYQPLKSPSLSGNHQFILPHELSQEDYPSKKLFIDKGCDLVLAEVSFPSTGQGIELGWADIAGIKIICVSRKTSKVSGSLKVVCTDFLIYNDAGDLIEKLLNYLSK